MDEVRIIIDTVALGTFVGYLVAGLKVSKPRAPSSALVLTAFGAGTFGAALLAAASAGAWSAIVLPQVVAQVVFSAVTAAGVAAGLTRTDAAGEAKREEVG